MLEVQFLVADKVTRLHIVLADDRLAVGAFGRRDLEEPDLDVDGRIVDGKALLFHAARNLEHADRAAVVRIAVDICIAAQKHGAPGHGAVSAGEDAAEKLLAKHVLIGVDELQLCLDAAILDGAVLGKADDAADAGVDGGQLQRFTHGDRAARNGRVLRIARNRADKAMSVGFDRDLDVQQIQVLDRRAVCNGEQSGAGGIVLLAVAVIGDGKIRAGFRDGQVADRVSRAVKRAGERNRRPCFAAEIDVRRQHVTAAGIFRNLQKIFARADADRRIDRFRNRKRHSEQQQRQQQRNRFFHRISSFLHQSTVL